MPNLSFSTSGATPTSWMSKFGYQPAPKVSPTAPVANALNSFQPNNALRSVVPTSPPVPTTPVKSTAITHPDGTQQVTTYHAPEPTTPAIKASTNEPAQTPATSGYSTIPGPYDPVTGLLKDSQPQHTTGTQHPGDPGFVTLPSQTPNIPTASTFPGIIGSLASTSQAGSQPAQDYTKQTAEYGSGNIPIGEDAKNIAVDYGKKIAEVGQQGAQFEGGQLTTGTSPVAEGNAAITAQTTAQQQQSLATGEEAALQGTGQELTAQEQAANALNSAAGQENTAQGLEQTGLTSAGSLSQPSATAQGQTTFDPLTGKFSGGSYQQNVQDVVNSIKGGNIGYTDGVNSLAALSPTAKADVLAALGPGFDTIASDAAAAAKGSNIQVGGTTQTGAAASGYTDALHAYNDMKATNDSADKQVAQVQKVLTDTGLNNTGSVDANKVLNSLSGRLGSDKVSALTTSITELQNIYSQLLSTGGTTPTGSEQQALQVLSPNSTPAQIIASITQLQAAAYNRLQPAYQKVSQYQSNLGGGGASGSGSSGATGNWAWNP